MYSHFKRIPHYKIKMIWYIERLNYIALNDYFCLWRAGYTQRFSTRNISAMLTTSFQLLIWARNHPLHWNQFKIHLPFTEGRIWWSQKEKQGSKKFGQSAQYQLLWRKQSLLQKLVHKGSERNDSNQLPA